MLEIAKGNVKLPIREEAEALLDKVGTGINEARSAIGGFGQRDSRSINPNIENRQRARNELFGIERPSVRKDSRGNIIPQVKGLLEVVEDPEGLGGKRVQYRRRPAATDTPSFTQPVQPTPTGQGQLPIAGDVGGGIGDTTGFADRIRDLVLSPTGPGQQQVDELGQQSGVPPTAREVFDQLFNAPPPTAIPDTQRLLQMTHQDRIEFMTQLADDFNNDEGFKFRHPLRLNPKGILGKGKEILRDPPLPPLGIVNEPDDLNKNKLFRKWLNEKYSSSELAILNEILSQEPRANPGGPSREILFPKSDNVEDVINEVFGKELTIPLSTGPQALEDIGKLIDDAVFATDSALNAEAPIPPGLLDEGLLDDTGGLTLTEDNAELIKLLTESNAKFTDQVQTQLKKDLDEMFANIQRILRGESPSPSPSPLPGGQFQLPSNLDTPFNV